MTVLRLFTGYFIQILPFAVLGLYPFSRHFRFSVRKTCLGTLGLILFLDSVFTVSGCYLKTVLPPDDSLFAAVNVVFLVSMIPYFLWLFYVAKAIWQQKLFVFSFLLTSALSMTSVCNTVSTWLLPGDMDGLPYRGFSSLVILLFTAVFTPVLLTILKNGYMPVADSLTKEEYGYLSVLSLMLFFILASGLLFNDYEEFYHSTTIFLYVALLVSVFFIYTIFFKMLSLSRDKVTATKEGDYLKHQLEIRDEQYRRLNDDIELSRRMSHDLKHHMLTIRGFLNEENVSEAEKYLDSCIKTAEDYEIVKLCEVPVINWVVSYYQSLAKNKGIFFHMRISVPPAKNISIHDADMAVLLGNLLENAISAAELVSGESRFIQLNITYSGNMLVITVDNGFTGELRTDGKYYFSTKENHAGIGLRSIEDIAEKYGGGVEFSHEAAIFHSSVMLNNLFVDVQGNCSYNKNSFGKYA